MLRCAYTLLFVALSVPGPLLRAPEASPAGPSGDWWEKTRAYTESAWDQALRWWQEERHGDAGLWDDLLPRLDEILTLQDRQQALPESAWVGEDRVSNAEAIDDLLDQAAVMLTGDVEYRRRMRAVEEAMADNRLQLAGLQRQRITAPSDSLWRQTVADIEAEIADREQVIADQQQTIEQIRQEFAAELRRLGLEIDDEGLEFMLSTVVGDDVVDMVLAFEESRKLTEQLEALTVQSREELTVARRYYGMYTVLLRVLVRMHDNLITRVDQRYLPRIQRIMNRARSLRQETRGLLARAPDPVLSANLQAQQLTLDAADRYAQYLKDQRRQVAESRERVARDLAVADNTYETVKVSGDLVEVMHSSRTLLERLFRLQVPPLKPFENLEMKREFERLTAALRTASTP